MKSFDPDPWATILAGSKADGTAITAKDYAKLHAARDRQKIVQMIHLRFTERYLDPALDNSKRHGFSILATGCLMVEALSSFINGWKNTLGCPGGGAAVFRGFFQTNSEFSESVAADFYKHVRCGILHQAETTVHWRVDRRAPLFVEVDGVRCVSALEFGKKLKIVLDRYTSELASADWKNPLWKKSRKKLRQICRNCGLSDADVSKLT